MRQIQPGGRYPAGFTGRLFDVQDLSRVAVRDDGASPRGLYVGLVTGTTAAAICRLTLGDPVGGGECTRTFLVGPSGAWISVAGWSYAKLESVDPAPLSQLCYAWTTEQPATPSVLMLPQVIGAGIAAVPSGATEIISGVADGGWSWRTVTTGAPIIVPAPVAAGQRSRVGGAQYLATVGSSVCWLLDPP